jgi:hypothetical protein
MSPQNQEHSRIQNLINGYKRDLIFMEQHYQQKIRNIQDQLLMLSRQPTNTGEQSRNLIIELGYLNEEKRRELDKINAKISDAINSLC